MQHLRTRTQDLLCRFIRRRRGNRLFVAGEIVEHAVCDEDNVFGEVEGCGDYEEGEEDEDY